METCGRPMSSATSFIAENTGRSGRPRRQSGEQAARLRSGCLNRFQPAGARGQVQLRRMLPEELRQAAYQERSVVVARHLQAVLAVQLRLQVGAAQVRGDLLLDELGLPLFDDQQRGFGFRKFSYF